MGTTTETARTREYMIREAGFQTLLPLPHLIASSRLISYIFLAPDSIYSVQSISLYRTESYDLTCKMSMVTSLQNYKKLNQLEMTVCFITFNKDLKLLYIYYILKKLLFRYLNKMAHGKKVE